MNDKYYTECDEKFYNKLMGQYGFSCSWDWGWKDYTAIDFYLSKKVINGANNGGVNFYKKNEYIRKETYISNQDLINLLEGKNNFMKNKDKSVCIKVHNEKIFHELWEKLAKLDFVNKEECPHFRKSPSKTYIWINHPTWGQKLVSADHNGGSTNWDYKFDTETDLDKLYEFYDINVKKQSKGNTMNQKIAIKVGNSQELSRIIQEFLFSKGFEWQYNLGKTIVISHGSYIITNFNQKNRICHGNSTDGCKVYDAATQMGEIIQLFNEPPVPEIIVENDSGEKYKAEFFPTYVKFGCAKIDNGVFSILNNLNQADYNTSEFKKVTGVSIGRGKFYPSLIKQIIEHPHFGKE